MKKSRCFVSILIVSCFLIGISLPSGAVAADKPIQIIFYWMMGKDTLQFKGLEKFMKGVEVPCHLILD